MFSAAQRGALAVGQFVNVAPNSHITYTIYLGASCVRQCFAALASRAEKKRCSR